MEDASRQHPSLPWLRFVAEGVIVVVSILVAFGIAAVRDARVDRAAEALLLEELRSEMIAVLLAGQNEAS